MTAICGHCGSDTVVHIRGHRARDDEPEATDGYECLDCGHWQENEIEPAPNDYLKTENGSWEED